MATKDIQLYDIFIKYSYRDIMELYQQSKTKEEQDFYANLSNIICKGNGRK